MGAIADFFKILIYQPIINLLIGSYQFSPIQNFAIAIVVVTLVSRLILWPLNRKSVQSQKQLQNIKPELDALKAKYGEDKEKLYKETMSLYARHKINPLGGCLPLLVQMPFFIALYQALQQGLDQKNIGAINDFLYPFIPHVTSINSQFLWMDLATKDPYYIMPIIVALTQLIQSRYTMNKQGATAGGAGQMMLMMPVVFLFIAIQLPAGLNFYILLTSFLAFVQQVGFREFFLFTWVQEVLAKPVSLVPVEKPVEKIEAGPKSSRKQKKK